jgi:uncharacterized protein (DUF1778 family)
MVKSKKRTGKTICLRVDRNTLDILERAAKHRRESISVFVRRAIARELAQLGYLTDEERKALLWWQDSP